VSIAHSVTSHPRLLILIDTLLLSSFDPMYDLQTTTNMVLFLSTLIDFIFLVS
jgi:hypothetical protein